LMGEPGTGKPICVTLQRLSPITLGQLALQAMSASAKCFTHSNVNNLLAYNPNCTLPA